MSDFGNYDYKLMIETMSASLQRLSNALKVVQDWWKENADTISAYISAFADFSMRCAAIEKMKKRQIVFTDDLTFEFAKQIYDTEDVDIIIENYYFGNDSQKMNDLISRCSLSNQITQYNEFYEEIIDAYERGHYRLACTGLFSLLDGVLADASNMIKETNFKKRIDAITEKMSSRSALSDIDRRLFFIYESVDSFNDSIFFNSDFTKTEPELLNRHWTIHGRSHRKYTKYDFLRELLWLEAIMILVTANEQQDSKKTE